MVGWADAKERLVRYELFSGPLDGLVGEVLDETVGSLTFPLPVALLASRDAQWEVQWVRYRKVDAVFDGVRLFIFAGYQ